MKTFASVVVVLVSLGSAGFAAQPEPTLFEAFATSPNTITKFSREVGAIDSSDATAHATVLVIEDTADSTNRMRGVRFDLVHNTGSDQVYLDEGQLRSFDGWPFSFPDRGPADLIGLLDRAIAELDEHAAQ
jgi:hypothetical protein